MGIGTIFLVVNVIVSSMKGKDAPADPWDGRTLEWAIASPAPEYNFKQLPLVRGYDALFKEKMDGRSELTPAEPLGPIHMPSPTILPLIMSIGLFIAGYGFMYQNNYVAVGGILVTFICMIIRSLKDDHGFHIEVEELQDKGAKA